MGQFAADRFPKVRTIHGAFAVSTTAVTKACNGNCRIRSLTGNLWVNPNATAVADATAIKLVATDDPLEIFVFGNLSLISDGTGATAEVIVTD